MIILIIFVTSCVYLAITLFYPRRVLKESPPPNAFREKKPAAKKELPAQAKSLELYLGDISSRRIFDPQEQIKTESPQEAFNAGLSKDISLIGIISGDNPQAVIEDKKTQKTFYLNKGQFIGEFQVEDIQEGKIILNHNSQKYELYL